VSMPTTWLPCTNNSRTNGPTDQRRNGSKKERTAEAKVRASV
jgi:hypothetical protein